MANKRNLSRVGKVSHKSAVLSAILVSASLAIAAVNPYPFAAQVPPRSESRQEQRERLVREAKKDIYAWCNKPGQWQGHIWPVVLNVTDKLAITENEKRLTFSVTCPDGKPSTPPGYSAEDMILFWAWSVVDELKRQREE